MLSDVLKVIGSLGKGKMESRLLGYSGNIGMESVGCFHIVYPPQLLHYYIIANVRTPLNSVDL